MRWLCNTLGMCVGPAALQGCGGANVSLSASLFVFAHIYAHDGIDTPLTATAHTVSTSTFLKGRAQKFSYVHKIDCNARGRLRASIFLSGTSTYLKWEEYAEN